MYIYFIILISSYIYFLILISKIIHYFCQDEYKLVELLPLLDSHGITLPKFVIPYEKDSSQLRLVFRTQFLRSLSIYKKKLWHVSQAFYINIKL